MELTIDQALQKAIEAHKTGKLQDAEDLNRAILQAQPKHPDANHNLGVLAVSVNKSEAALPFFKTALEANPNQGQFWLSYIDVLIKEKQFDNARNVLEQGKKSGLAGEKVEELEAQLTASFLAQSSEASANKISTFTQQRKKVSAKKEKKKNLFSNLSNLNQARNPSQVELSALLDLYQQGIYDPAENLAKNLTEQYPNHPFGWKVLGAVFKQTGRLQDSLIASERALGISPNDAESHSNLANTLKDLGRLEEAGTSYKKAIAIKPDYAEAHSNLGFTLQELGRLEDAAVSYKKAISIRPEYAEAHSNLGNTLKELGRNEEAETSYREALAIKPELAEAYSNLGCVLKDLARFDDAETNFKKAIAIKPEFAEPHSNLGNTLHELGRLEEAEESYKRAIAIKPNLAETYNNLGNTLKERGRLQEAEESYKKAISIKPDYAQVHYNLGFALKELGRLEEAEASYAQAIRLEPDFINARNEILTCLYLMDKKLLLFEELDFLIKEDIATAVIGSLICRSALRYGEEKPNIFCNEPLKHALLVDLKSRFNFEEIFIRNSKSILSEDKRSNRRQTLLSNGYQTSGNIFDLESKLTDQIQKTIRLEIERYRTNFESSEEGFIRKWPKEYRLYGWLISMKSGGELQPHIHENGWLSGSIYINVPPNSKNDSGKLVVALGKDSDATNSHQNSKKIIDVVTGSMALFPASLMHHTIPFESDEERIVLAFDVIPKS
jgi:tetratricopeptide (TPR) repeat protein